MKLISVALAVSLVALTGCKTSPENMNNHWRLSNVPDRMNYQFINGYDAHTDGSPREFFADQRKDLHQTLKRHVLHMNSDNPMSYEVGHPDPELVEEIKAEAEQAQQAQE